MYERLFFETGDLPKREILEALKNEQKVNKKIPIFDENGEEIAKILKYDVYSSYIDFWLDNIIPDYATKQPGRIQNLIIHEVENSKGAKVKRVKTIIA